MTVAGDTRAFQAEVRELLDLMVHSLYSHREVFLRELISNASDALDRVRFAALTDESLGVDPDQLHVRLELDRELRNLRVIDDGIGMTREELVDNVGTIARSGTRRFREELAARAGSGSAGDLPDLIGQFGVGFYSCFMVADEIRLETCRAGSARGVSWRSRGDGEYTLEEHEADERGTCVSLHLRERSEREDYDFDQFLDPARLAELVRRYSDFVEYPVVMDAALLPGRDDLEKRTLRTAEGEREVVVLNSRRPLWSRPRDEITREEYARFYQHLSHDWSEPRLTVHFRAEGTSEYTALLFVPGHRPFDFFERGRERSHVALYVKHVFVMAGCEELVPPWLRFLRGVVDAQDLPLNVSREMLQENRGVARIRARLVKKVLDGLEQLLRDDRAAYRELWRDFGAVLKEGIVVDAEHSERVARLALFESTTGDESTTLPEYVARMPAGQDEIYCLAGDDAAALAASPHLEAVAAREREVLLLTDPVDEWVLQHLHELDGKRLRALDRGDLPPADEAAAARREERERELRDVLEVLEARLGERVGAVRLSGRLTDSAAVLVSPPEGLGPHMRRLAAETGHAPPEPRRVLELNPDHPLVQRLQAMVAEDRDDARIADWAELLHGQALLAEGSPLSDPKRFARLLTGLMLPRA